MILYLSCFHVDSLSPSQCPAYFPELGNVDLVITSGLFVGLIAFNALNVAMDSVKPKLWI